MMKNKLIVILVLLTTMFATESAQAQVVSKKRQSTKKTPTTRKDSTAVQPQSTQSPQVPVQQVPDVQNQAVFQGVLNNDAVIVSSPYQRVLHDNGTYIDERGYHQTTFDIIRKEDGDFALAYTSSTENLDIYTKGILFTLKPDLNQRGQALIFTKYDEEVRDLELDEFWNGIISIGYTCNDAKCVYSNGHRDNKLTILKYSEVGRDGKVKNREVDDTRAQIELKAMMRPAPSDDISILYNVDNKGKIALASSHLNNYEMSCDLQRILKVESNPNGQKVQPKIGSVSLIDGHFIISTPTLFKTVDWNLPSKGLLSGKIEQPVWPILVLDGFCVSNDHGGECSYDNYPYHRFSDTQLKVDEIERTFVVNNSKLGVISKNSNKTFLHMFNSKLERRNAPIELAKNIRFNSLSIEEVDNEKLLLFYKTDEGDSVAYRFTLYDWKNNKVLWSDEKAFWTEEDKQWDNIHKITRYDNNRFIVVSFTGGTDFYQHEQALEYRLVTINVNE